MFRPTSVLVAVTLASPLAAQTRTISVTPNPVVMRVGDTVQLAAVVTDSTTGERVDVPVLFRSGNRSALAVSRDGQVVANEGGDFQVVAFAGGARAEITVRAQYSGVARIEMMPYTETLYVGASVPLLVRIVDQRGYERHDLRPQWSTEGTALAVSSNGIVTGVREGRGSVVMQAGGARQAMAIRVVPNPVTEIVVTASADSVRQGDVVHLTAAARDSRGRPVPDVPVHWAWAGDAVDTAAAQFPPVELDQQGRFVAYRTGEYTVMAIGPGQIGRAVIRVTERNQRRDVELVGHGRVSDVHTSDLWVWEGQDGRDYAITGTWGANGAAYFWDVTDPSSPLLVDSVVVDARTVNDVKVSEDGRICVISREGASNRRNGIVVLDCSNPRDVSILSQYDDDLTGGVHNVFVWRNHVYAVNNGRKYDIISIEDPRNPRRVGVFELDTPGHAIHDVWIVDGIAYSSNWGDGTVLVDVGNGIAGGSPSNPVEIGRVRAQLGRNHAAFPYHAPDGRRYLFMGDEIFPYGLSTEAGGTPNRAAGYVHIMDITDLEHPEEVARYEVPEAGSHNFWIEGDRLYAAFYNGGLRVVDISGELKGNLYFQGREVAAYFPYDPQGHVANAPFVWGPQPFKGNIFFSDWNSGLWAVKVDRPALTP